MILVRLQGGRVWHGLPPHVKELAVGASAQVMCLWEYRQVVEVAHVAADDWQAMTCQSCRKTMSPKTCYVFREAKGEKYVKPCGCRDSHQSIALERVTCPASWAWLARHAAAKVVASSKNPGIWLDEIGDHLVTLKQGAA